MDPSLSASTDHRQPPRPPQQFIPFQPFAVPTAFGAPSAVFGASSAVFATGYNQHVAQATPNLLPPHPSFNNLSYADMIYSAIAALNEPDGSSKQAISSYLERIYPGLPASHDSLLTHHLTSLKNSGFLVMVKESYKIPSAPPSASTLEASGSDLFGTTDHLDHNLSDLNAPPQKRGRGRPPKAKPETQLTGAQLLFFKSNEQPGSDPNLVQQVFSSSEPVDEAPLVKRRPGRPRKNGAQPPVQASPVSAFTKRRGQPPGRSGPGRPRKPKSVTAPAMVFPYAANGASGRGRPRRADTVVPSGSVVAEGGVASGKRRGRPPKVGGMISKPMKPIRGTGRPVGRPRKNVTQDNTAYGELKRKLELFQDTVKEAVGVLKAEIGSENQVAVLAIRELEGLAVMDISAEAPAEEAEPQEPRPQTQLQDEEAEAQKQAESRARAQAMQEALF